ncbi:MAG: zinc-dependent alcohol dehydrogenase family protein [bacterium]
MKAFVISEPYKGRIEIIPYPKPKPGEIAIRVKRVGICGTDFHIYEGAYMARYPIIPGHEFSGIVDRIGESVIGWEIGDHVTVDPSLFCGQCQFCLTGRTNQCETFGAIGFTAPGALSEYVAVPAQKVFKLPETLSYEEGAFVEPLACVVYGMHRLQLKFGDRVLVFGAGSIGQQLIQAIARAGASELVVVDISEAKLSLAKKFGATKVVLSKDVEHELGKNNYPYGFDVVVDATGIASVIQQAFNYLGPTGKYLQFGVAPKNTEVKINPFELYHKDWTFIGSMAINQTFIQALNWLKEKRINVLALISKTIELEELPIFLAKPKNPVLLKIQIKI